MTDRIVGFGYGGLTRYTHRLTCEFPAHCDWCARHNHVQTYVWFK